MNLKVSKEINYEKELNSLQFNIVRDTEGPCLILAGAGSGKTRVLVYRVCYLLEAGISPSEILLVTFTNKAAREMIGRVEGLLGAYPRGFWAGTFHHIANLLLRKYGGVLDVKPNFTILDEDDSISLLKRLMERFKNNEEFPTPKGIKKILSLSVNTLESIQDIIHTRFPSNSGFIQDIEWICNEYRKKKKALNLMDYDDLLSFWYKLLRNESVGTAISEKFRYILVDEYHDTNNLQSRILYQMAKIHRNITVVGDDAQSIYSFRGATVNNIMEFPKVYSDAKKFYLDMNYRSTPQILDFANESISKNKVRFLKKLKSVRKSGIKPVLVRCHYPRDEASFVSQRLLQLLKFGISPSEIGILFRSRYQSAELEMELNKLKVPYVIRGGLRFFEQAHIKDVISYFRVVENFTDEIAWKRIFSLTEGIGSKTAERLLEYIAKVTDFTEFCDRLKEVNLSRKALENLKIVIDLLHGIKDLKSIPEGIDLVMEKVYAGHLNKKYRDEEERKEDLKMLKEITSVYTGLSDFVSETSLQEYARGENPDNPRPVTLSTIHQAKGLEWKIVFLIGVADKHFPHPSSSSDIMALEEERRIFYVGVTRAKEDIYISYYIRDFFRTFTNRKSLFLEEIPGYLFEEWNY